MWQTTNTATHTSIIIIITIIIIIIDITFYYFTLYRSTQSEESWSTTTGISIVVSLYVSISIAFQRSLWQVFRKKTVIDCVHRLVQVVVLWLYGPLTVTFDDTSTNSATFLSPTKRIMLMHVFQLDLLGYQLLCRRGT